MKAILYILCMLVIAGVSVIGIILHNEHKNTFFPFVNWYRVFFLLLITASTTSTLAFALLILRLWGGVK